MSEKIEAQRKISDWMQNYGWSILWDQKNQEGFDTFHSKGGKPDILLQKNGYNVLVEIKPGKDHIDIIDGIEQTVEYAGEYYTGRNIYTTEKPGEPIDIDAFLFATKYSKYGYLYSEEDQHNYVKGAYLKKRHNLIERPITHSVTRLMWRLWEKGLAIDHYRDLRKGEGSKDTILPSKPKIGTIVSQINAKTRQESKEPYFYLNSNEFAAAGYDDIYALN